MTNLVRILSIRSLWLIAVLAIALGLAGCVEVAMESEFQEDGSARHSIASTVDRAFLDDEMLGGEIDFEEIEREAEATGLEVERIDDGNRVGVRVSTTVEDNEDFAEALNELFGALGEGVPAVEPFSGGFTISGGGFTGTTYRFELTVDGDALFPDEEGEFEDDLDIDFGMDMMRQFFDVTYTAALPGEITDHNGTDIGGGRVRWDIPFQGTATFYAESESGSSFGVSLMLIGGVVVGFLAVVLVVVGAVLLLRGQSARPATSLDRPVQNTPSSSGELLETDIHDPDRSREQGQQ